MIKQRYGLRWMYALSKGVRGYYALLAVAGIATTVVKHRANHCVKKPSGYCGRGKAGFLYGGILSFRRVLFCWRALRRW